jgi:hypothetical protein
MNTFSGMRWKHAGQRDCLAVLGEDFDFDDDEELRRRLPRLSACRLGTGARIPSCPDQDAQPVRLDRDAAESEAEAADAGLVQSLQVTSAGFGRAGTFSAALESRWGGIYYRTEERLGVVAIPMGWAQGVTTSLRGGPVLRCSQVWLMSSSRVCSRSKVSFPSMA